jgi:hypothetical protein
MSSTTPAPATTYTAGRGVYIRLTVTAPDQDRDGFDSIDDCDDTDGDVNPDAPEVWYNGQDENCDGGNDYDQDGDGYEVESHGGDDCDDTDSHVNPSRDDRNPEINSTVEELWYDGVDQNCDEQSDYDQDGDGHDAQSAGGDDCDDTDPRLNVDCSEDTDPADTNSGDDSGADSGPGNDVDDAKSGCGKKDDPADTGGKKGCCGGGSAMMLTTLLWTLTKRRKVA